MVQRGGAWNEQSHQQQCQAEDRGARDPKHSTLALHQAESAGRTEQASELQADRVAPEVLELADGRAEDQAACTVLRPGTGGICQLAPRNRGERAQADLRRAAAEPLPTVPPCVTPPSARESRARRRYPPTAEDDVMTKDARRSVWAWGLEADDPSQEERVGFAKKLGEQWGRDLPVPEAVPLSAVELRPPRIQPSDALRAFCAQDPYERAFHTYGSHFTERLRAFRGEFPHPPDLVAHPRDEDELERVLAFCTDHGCRAVPWGGGSSVVYGLTVPEDDTPCVTVDLDHFDRVLELDETSRAARLQAGVLGPALEDQLRPSGHTLRHFPQSFEWSADRTDKRASEGR
jgi:hypothetical protein